MIDLSIVGENLFTILILFFMLLMIYCKVVSKTIGEIIIDIKEATAVEPE